MSFKLAETESRAKIKVVGIGGGGGNAVNTMVESGLVGVEFIVGNTDMQALEQSKADIRLQLGPNLAKGLGAGARPDVGQEAAEESIDDIRKLLEDTDMVFVTAGLGGGTGTGGAPVVAKVAKELGALTVGVVTKPFAFEGKKRMKNADAGWKELKAHVDTIITIPNDRLISMAQKGTRFIDGMKMADDVLVQAVKGITDLINLPGYINPDFADVRTVMNEMGPALMGAGHGVGENRASEAVNMAIASPLLQDISIDGAKGVLVNISARQDTLTMAEVTQATTKIYDEVHEDANIILGVIFDDNLGDELRVTVIATGIRAVEDFEDVSDNIRPLPGACKREARVQSLPMTGGPGGGGREAVAKGGRKAFPSLMADEDFDRPTFLRKNES
ncbi:cell division protein FtsZ [Desulfurivibrio alkaliphilus]|uniref:Cell division protein FtsZ n=1 Tax=Desulfurivibrio alkaliphilus (strain DSM 19089 / UNIQEM U267 / AHT2) TaxID=589865 RepID=D6Z3P6_DESAT|nr:cell division protein FtsZ [Desulfurivibrio alkaliphilus]ADH86171.1 cell division protein FtsZ [Desulfurivibrio alkaliphilus AHT 2]